MKILSQSRLTVQSQSAYLKDRPVCCYPKSGCFAQFPLLLLLESLGNECVGIGGWYLPG